MKFPGKRKSKHYFPVTQKERIPFHFDYFNHKQDIYVVGIDQVIVDIEAHVDDGFIAKYGIQKGQSVLLDDQTAKELYTYLKQNRMISGEYPGGAVGNTLHNYSVLSDGRSVLLGVINRNITVGDYAYHYICNTSAMVDLSYLRPIDGPMGQAICFVTPDGERSFGICRGLMDELYPEDVSEKLITNSAALLLTAYVLRNEDSPIFKSTMKAVEIARANKIPVILSLGTEILVREKKEKMIQFLKDYVNVVAMNIYEGRALTDLNDPLLIGEKTLDWADLVLVTDGPRGLFLCGYIDKELARKTKDQLHSKSIADYNLYEYSRAMPKKECREPIKMYTHINPYMGGPGTITSTNGAGDAALAALIHDMSSNVYHRRVVPNSTKHQYRFLTYSSISQISKYANRVSYEVIDQNSPRLLCGLPEREDSLEEAYWER